MDENKNVEVDLPLSYWFAMCENNIYTYAKQQFSQCGIAADLQPCIIEGVLSKVQKDAINLLINYNAEQILNSNNGEVIDNGNNNE